MRPLQGPSADRGVGTYAAGLLGGLIAEGFDSSLTLLLDADLPEPALPAGAYKLAGSRRRYRGQLSAYEEAVALGTDLQRIHPGLYHAIDLRLPGRSPCPLVVTLHDLIPWAWGGPRMRGERLRYWLGKRLLKRADTVLAVSKATAADAERLAGVDPDRIKVVYEAADPVFQPQPGAAGRVKEMVGSRSRLPAVRRRARRAGRTRPACCAPGQWRKPLNRGCSSCWPGFPGRQAPPAMPGAITVGHVEKARARRPVRGGRMPCVSQPVRGVRAALPGGDGLRLPGGRVPQLQPAGGGRHGRRAGGRRRRRGARPGGGQAVREPGSSAGRPAWSGRGRSAGARRRARRSAPTNAC